MSRLAGAGPDADPVLSGLYFLADAAQDEVIYPRLRGFAVAEDVVPLYQGEAGVELAAVAPYLVSFGTGAQVFDWLWDTAWYRPWGVLIRSAAPIEDLRAHFRRLTRVQTEDGRVLLFRFYDPRVLSAFLPTCAAAEAAEMFGPVEAFGVTIAEAGPGPRLIDWFTRGPTAVVCERAVLGEVA